MAPTGTRVARCSTTATRWRTPIERAPDYRVRHGEAVALGMVYVAELARLAGRLDERDRRPARSERSASVGLPTSSATAAPFDDLLATMRVDKKSRGDRCCASWCSTGSRSRPILEGPDESILRAAYDHLSGRHSR